jgi:hypothetical protein
MHLNLINNFSDNKLHYINANRLFDKFYTQPSVAETCINITYKIIGENAQNYTYIEPSAGGGAFLDLLPLNTLGIDISPPEKRIDILKMDFLQWKPEGLKNIVVIGNPPFGKNASLALKFINHAARFASYIAFILPRTFEKQSMKQKISDNLELIYQYDLSPDSFHYCGRDYSVPVVFQIWQKLAKPKLDKPNKLPINHHDFAFIKNPLMADFAFQRVGARAGLVSYDGLKKSPQSHYFIKSLNDNISLMTTLEQIDWSVHKYKTAGNPSISKRELIDEYMRAIS